MINNIPWYKCMMLSPRCKATRSGLRFARLIAHLVVAGAVFVAFPKAQAQNSPFPLGFPIHEPDLPSGAEVNPYTAPIVSVVDHFANPFGVHDGNAPTVVTYTGELGALLSSCTIAPCGSNNLIFKS